MTQTVSYPVRPHVFVTGYSPRDISDWEYHLIQRLRQLAREGNGDLALIDPRARTLRVISSDLEKLDH